MARFINFIIILNFIINSLFFLKLKKNIMRACLLYLLYCIHIYNFYIAHQSLT